jgi:hypothetical protein
MCTFKPLIYRLIIPIYLSFFYYPRASAQENLILYPDFYYRLEKSFLLRTDYHASFHPQQISLAQQRILLDSLYPGTNRDLFRLNPGKTNIIINPIIQGSFEAGPKFLQHEAVGFRLASEIGSRVSIDLNYSVHVITNDAFAGSRTDSAGIIYHWGTSAKLNDNFRLFNSINGRITYTPLKFLSFQLGNDKHFFGDGYRSLFLSDNAPPYPFFATHINIWKIKYTHLVSILKDDTIGNYQHLQTKYAVTHFLSWNATSRLNFNLFETVIWRQRKDSLNQRGFDFNYLNPFVLYRPIEYNLGSPDNVLVGIGFHYVWNTDLMIYGQLLLDEFYFKEEIKNSGWWAIKDAIQIGTKCYDFLNIRDLYVQLEYNQARPYTYGHSYPLQNYGYLLQPLAHPLGTNFREGLLIIRYAKNRWLLNSKFTFSRYGLEPGGKTVGADIYRSSNFYSKTYGNFIGQGITTNVFDQEINISRILQSHWGFTAEAGIRNSIMFLPEKQQHFFFTFGIKTLLYREEKLF